MHGHVVDDLDGAGLGVDLDRADVDDEPVRSGGRDPVLVIRRVEVRRRPERDRAEARLHALRKPLGVPVGHPGHLAQRQLRVADVLADRVDLRADAARCELHRPDADPREARGVVARRDRPGRRLRVELGQDRDVLRCAAELVGDHLGAHRAMPLTLRRRPEADADPAERVDGHRRPLRVPRLRRLPRTLDRRLGERDVAHVRDRRLDDAREPDPGQTALVPRTGDAVAELVVPRQLERAVEARLVVPRVVERARRRPVRHPVGGNEVPAGELGRVEPESTRGDRHHALEAEVELRPAEPAVEPRRERCWSARRGNARRHCGRDTRPRASRASGRASPARVRGRRRPRPRSRRIGARRARRPP